ncbi:MAG TPA: LLM class flavin-dependent oxidoreductase [Streptosporangiaceae bacterium]|nr:LLM class flavin-dependent oxidoreductase [Streptosporangiaceae bacterium]
MSPSRAPALGLSIASQSGLAPAAIGGLARAAERAGFTAVLVAEGHGDALCLRHPVAAATSRVRVGTAVANAALRPPVLAAKTAVSGLRYDIVRRAVLPDGVLQQHVLRGSLPDGTEVELHAAMYLQVLSAPGAVPASRPGSKLRRSETRRPAPGRRGLRRPRPPRPRRGVRAVRRP